MLSLLLQAAAAQADPSRTITLDVGQGLQAVLLLLITSIFGMIPAILAYKKLKVIEKDVNGHATKAADALKKQSEELTEQANHLRLANDKLLELTRLLGVAKADELQAKHDKQIETVVAAVSSPAIAAQDAAPIPVEMNVEKMDVVKMQVSKPPQHE